MNDQGMPNVVHPKALDGVLGFYGTGALQMVPQRLDLGGLRAVG